MNKLNYFKSVCRICAILMVLFLTNCKHKEVPCTCNTEHLQENDSILNAFKENTAFQQKRKDLFRMYPLENQFLESYRLYVQGALSYYTHTYLIQNNRDQAYIIVREFISPDISHTSAKLNQTLTFPIDQNQWKKIKYSIRRNCFWTNSLNKKPSSCLDSNDYFLEAYDPRRENCANEYYHADAWGSCDKTDLWKIYKVILEKVDSKKLHY